VLLSVPATPLSGEISEWLDQMAGAQR